MLFVSADRPEKISTIDKKSDFDYVLLSDSKLEAAKAFGIAFHLDDDMLKMFIKYGIDVEEATGETHHGLPVPSVFILDTEGVIRFSYVDPNYKARVDPALLVAAAKASLR